MALNIENRMKYRGISKSSESRRAGMMEPWAAATIRLGLNSFDIFAASSERSEG